MGKRVVYRVDDEMDRQEILATTYQMRNYYRQLGDGFFSTLDIMNYIQHHQITKWCKKGNHILDVCCGRGLMLPLLRYNNKNIGSYTGVDIEPKNAIFTHKRVTNGKQIDKNYYPFPVDFIHSNVAKMSTKTNKLFDVIIYTSAIEHMHKEMGQQSLYECRKLSTPKAVMVLTCPNTPEGQNGYDTQYRAHVYEWKRSELTTGLKQAGFEIITEFGLTINKKILEQECEKLGLLPLVKRLSQFVPNEWLVPVFAPMFPKQSKEIGFICKVV